MRAPRISIILIVAGAALALISGVVLAFQATPAAIATDRAEMPNAVEFVAQGGEYRLMLISQPSGAAGTEFECTIYLADGTTTPASIGDTIAPPAGSTIATCQIVGSIPDDSESDDFVYGVAPVIPAIAIAAIAGLVIGLGALGTGFILLIVGRRTGTGRRAAR